MENKKKCCSECKHLQVLNKRDIYAKCIKNDWIFKPFEADPKCTVCNFYEKK